MDLGLGRVRDALARLGDPQRRFAAVQIAGTNGKGSTAAMAEAIWRAAGARTGLYTSPHLARFTERIRVAGVEADGDRLAALDARVAATGVPLTYFEVATLLAFLLMAEEGVEVAVLETGLGGRLDAVTACEPAATAVTSIALDHTQYLGTTLAEIAREKAGIAKPGVPLFLGPVPPEADDEIASIAAAVGAPLVRVAAAPEVPVALAGGHQAINAALGVALARAAATAAGRPLDDAAVATGLRTVSWPGRLERIAPDVLLDGAHNPDGVRALLAALPPQRPRALVLSVVRGKDAGGMLAALAPAFDAVFVTRSRNTRSLPPRELAAAAAPGVVEVVDDPLAALAAARRAVSPAGLVVVAGSLFLVGQIRAHVLGEPSDPDPGDPMP